MALSGKLRRLRAMAWNERRLIAEAAFALGIARLALVCVPFRRIAPWLMRQPRRPQMIANPLFNIQMRRAVTIAARNVPWKAVCLPQAMAAKWMLARRGYPSILHLGVGKDHTGAMIAHAWLDVGDVTVVGAAGKEAVTPVGHFG
jgi:hypothetical protein